MTELPTPLNKKAEALFKWRQFYISLAGSLIISRVYGQDKKQCMELFDKSFGDKGSLLKDLVDHVFDIKKSLLNDPHQKYETKRLVEEYAMQKFDEYFIEVNSEALGKPQ